MTYAIWSGVGIILIAILGWLIYGQAIDRAGAIGMMFIILGVVILNLFSHASTH